MKIYITEKTKIEFEKEINNLIQYSPLDSFEDYSNFGKKQIYQELLSKAIILPEEDSWEDVLETDLKDYNRNYPYGVIISK